MGGVGGILCLAEILRGQAALIKGNVVKVIKNAIIKIEKDSKFKESLRNKKRIIFL